MRSPAPSKLVDLTDIQRAGPAKPLSPCAHAEHGTIKVERAEGIGNSRSGRQGIAGCAVTVDRVTASMLSRLPEPSFIDLQPGPFEVADRNHPWVPVVMRRLERAGLEKGLDLYALHPRCRSGITQGERQHAIHFCIMKYRETVRPEARACALAVTQSGMPVPFRCPQRQPMGIDGEASQSCRQ